MELNYKGIIMSHTIQEIIDAFWDAVELSNYNSLASIRTDTEMLLVGYNKMIYGKWNLKTMECIYYKGWEQITIVNKKHINKSKLKENANKIIDSRPEYRKV